MPSMSKRLTIDEKIAIIITLFDEKDRLIVDRIKNLQGYKSWSDVPENMLKFIMKKLEDRNNMQRVNNVKSKDDAKKIKERIWNIFAIKVPILDNFNPAMFKLTMRILSNTVEEEIQKHQLKKGIGETNQLPTREIKKKLSFDMDKLDELKSRLDKAVKESKNIVQERVKKICKGKEYTLEQIEKIFDEESKKYADEEFKEIIEYYSFKGDTVLNSLARGQYSLLKNDIESLRNKYEIDEDILTKKVLELSKIRDKILDASNNDLLDINTLYRGIGIRSFIKMIDFSIDKCENMDDVISGILTFAKGKTFSDSSLISTSRDIDVAIDFAEESSRKCSRENSRDPIFKEKMGVLLKIKLTGNNKGKDISVISSCSDEEEILLPPGQKLQITEIEHSGYKLNVSVNAI